MVKMLAHATPGSCPAVVMDLVLEKTMRGIFSVFNDGNQKFTPAQVRLLSLLAKPCAIVLTNSLRFRECKAEIPDLVHPSTLRKRMKKLNIPIGRNAG